MNSAGISIEISEPNLPSGINTVSKVQKQNPENPEELMHISPQNSYNLPVNFFCKFAVS